MRYQVPQFIGIEDKIFGPFTFKQFVYMGGSLAIAFLAYKLLPFYLAIFVMIPALALGAALAFYRLNEKPFIEVMESAFKFYGGGRLYVWKKEEKKPDTSTISLTDVAPVINLPKLSQSKTARSYLEFGHKTNHFIRKKKIISDRLQEMQVISIHLT